MKEPVVLKADLTERFEAAMAEKRAILISAPCGFGKTTAAQALVAGRSVSTCIVSEPDFSLPDTAEDWDVLLLDDLQYLAERTDQ